LLALFSKKLAKLVSIWYCFVGLCFFVALLWACISTRVNSDPDGSIFMHPPLGIIEGFFGPVWTWAQRHSLMRGLASHNYSFYLYAPKSDRLLRRDWQLPFTDQWQTDVQNFSGACVQLGVNFGVGITPFDLHKHLSDQSLQVWREKIRNLGQLGVQTIAILFDDMDAKTPDLVNTQLRIIEAAQSELKNQRIIVCPSYYSNDIVLDRVFGQRPPRYLDDLGRGLDQGVDVFWTGEEVCSRQFSVADLNRVAEQLQRKPLLWDNYPVNDGPRMSQYLHLRGFTGRPAAIAQCIAGHAVNPALQPTLSQIPAITLAHSYQQADRYVYTEAFIEAAQTVVGHELANYLHEDLLALQDVGLDRLGDRHRVLKERYRQFDHPAALEVLAWLDGQYATSAEQVQTQ
jgi:hyaluronoglucosaminidase